MPRKRQRPAGLSERVGRYRRKLAKTGVKRIDVAVPARDAVLVRHAAQMLRGGGDAAERMRAALTAAAAPESLDGSDLVAFFRASPLVGIELDDGRDRSAGRPIEL